MNVICAYSVNIDALHNITKDELIQLMPSGFALDEIGLHSSIAGLDDLLDCMLFCIQQGMGAEVLIDSREAAREIEEAFSWQMRLGGNAGIMANVLADLGARPLLNAPALGSRLAAMLHAGVEVPLFGAPADPRVAAAETKAGQEMVHFVFQFPKGLEVGSGHNRIISPEDNRFIASYDPVNTTLQSSMDFDSYSLQNILDYDGALISGFHLVPLDKCRDVFSKKMDHLRSWKKRNPDLFIHIETGSFPSPLTLSHLLDLIPEIPADSLGMNEDELKTASGYLRESAYQEQQDSWQKRIQAALSLHERLGISRVAVHTREYIFSIMRDGILSAGEEISALEKGVDAAASLAAGMKMEELPWKMNENGLCAVEDLLGQGAVETGRGASLFSEGKVLSLTPSRQVKRPVITVGLGDTATASILFYEIEAIKKRRAVA